MSEIKPIDVDDPIIEDCVEAGRVLLDTYLTMKELRPEITALAYIRWHRSIRQLEDILAIDSHVRETRQL